MGRKDSWCFHAVGSSNATLLGSTAAEGLPRIGRTSIATRWRSCGLPQSASCSENFVIPPDVFGQTLRVTAVSIIAFAVSCFMLGKEPISSLWVLGKAYPVGFTLAVTVNIFFDYVSVNKSRFFIVVLA